MMRQSAISNEELIAQFRDWRSQWKPSLTEIEDEVSYISKLAEFMAPVPLSKVTKAVLQDFQLEEQMRPQPRESRVKIVRAVIAFDAFRAEKSRKKNPKRPAPCP
jgi:hypothetical protein